MQPKSPNEEMKVLATNLLPRYKMIVFDAGGTLVSAEWPLVIKDLTAVAHKTGLKVDPAEVMVGLRQVWGDVIAGRIPDSADSREAVTAFWINTLARSLSIAAGHPLPVDGEGYDPQAVAAANSFYPRFDDGGYHRLIDGARDVLQTLKRRNLRLAVLSNWSPRLPQILERLSILHFFEFVIVSACVGLAKPDPAIFDLAAQRSGCRLDELLYIGDSPASDIAGSQAAGWDSVLIANRHADAVAPLKVKHLSDLPALLGLE
jgi:putative hydrolase of the HAD superfamily